MEFLFIIYYYIIKGLSIVVKICVDFSIILFYFYLRDRFFDVIINFICEIFFLIGFGVYYVEVSYKD